MSNTTPNAWREQAARIVAELTLQEKASLCSGADFWNTKAVEHKGVPAFMLTDGPHGLRKQSSAADHLGLNESVPATCFPSGVGLAASWNRELVREVAAALGREASAERVGVLLGPAVNIKRHPLGGRGFEYLSEDPWLSGELAAAYVEGLQSQGVGASLKHFAVNNQETNRLLVDARVDERTLREIYLRGFEIAVTRSQPWTVMSAYNRVNGEYASDNSWLLRDVLHEQWGFDGVVVTDWGAEDDRVAGMRAGTALEMPGNGGLGDAEILAAVENGQLDERILDTTVVRLVALHLAVADNLRAPATSDPAAHHALARRAAVEATVLLKNDGPVLPLTPGARIAVLGGFAAQPRYQGGGSSHINPTRLETFLAALAAEHPEVKVDHAPGYRVGDPVPDTALLEQAAQTCAAADVAVVLVGLSDQEESEGYDRRHLRLSPSHEALVATALDTGIPVVVALSNGAPVEMPWIDQVSAVLECHLGGQAGGAALADIVTGVTEPGGRLAETFPVRLQDTPAYLNWPGTARSVEYREGLFVGYRYYDSVGLDPLFPFGHGLGYSEIVIRSATLDHAEIDDGRPVRLRVDLENPGERAGSQVVQVYVHQEGAVPHRPEQELKAFEKVWLEPGERRAIDLDLDRDAFAWWSTATSAWVVDDARFEVRVGTSSRNIAARAVLRVHGAGETLPSQGQNTALGALLTHPVLGGWARGLRETFIAGQGSYDPDSPEFLLVEAFSRELPLRSLVRIGALIGQDDLDRAVRVLAGSADEGDLDAFTTAASDGTATTDGARS